MEDRADVYLNQLFQEDEPVLKEMETLAQRLSFPVVGSQVGRLLYLVAKLSGARCVFEMGSGFGYSAWWFARAVGVGGQVHWTDRSKENLKLAKDFLTRSSLSKKMVFHCEDAMKAFKEFKGEVDLLFVDMDKESYPEAYHLFKEHSHPGSILMADNMFWDGRVFEKASDDATRGIQEFTRLVFEDPELTSTLLPIRDGVLLSVAS